LVMSEMEPPFWTVTVPLLPTKIVVLPVNEPPAPMTNVPLLTVVVPV
jgi:hypothetical protein